MEWQKNIRQVSTNIIEINPYPEHCKIWFIRSPCPEACERLVAQSGGQYAAARQKSWNFIAEKRDRKNSRMVEVIFVEEFVRSKR